jgi:hypothetical protein
MRALSLVAVTAVLGLAACGSSSNATTSNKRAGARAACVKVGGSATTAASANASSTTATTRSAPAAGPAAKQVIASGNASGQEPCARAAGTVHGAISITLRGTSEPPQGATWSWRISCEKENGAAAGTGAGQKTLAMPGSETITLPSVSPAKCVVSAAAQLAGSGDVHVSIVAPHKPS